MLLTIDLGNSYLKMGLFKGKQLVQKAKLASSEVTNQNLSSLLGKLNFEAVIVSSVVPILDKVIVEFFQNNFGLSPIFIDAAQTPFNVKLANRKEIGADLLAGLAGGIHFFPNQNLLIVDAGTIATFSLLSQEQDFLGAVFYPGIHASLEIMHKATALLPPTTIKLSQQAIGYDTVTAIQRGVYYGQLGAYKELIRRLTTEGFGRANCKILVTGGGGEIFKDLASDYLPELVLYGLHLFWEMFYAK